MMLDGHAYINVDGHDVWEADQMLYRASVEYPSDLVVYWDEVTNQLAVEQTDIEEEIGSKEWIQVHLVLLLLLHVTATP